MLNCLRIRDLAIIDELELELGPGLNVLTGETGSGKSILVTALELVLGGKGRADLVRSGASAGEVEALFELGADVEVRKKLEAIEVPGLGGSGLGADAHFDGPPLSRSDLSDRHLAVDGELLVRRVVSTTGRTRAFLNGKPVSQQVLADIVHGLADISSQHEHHTLSDPSTHLS